MHYVIGDIHNESGKLKQVLEQIEFNEEDELILLGDLFDRGYDEADPAEVYFMLSAVHAKKTWVSGNHDRWLAEYIKRYFQLSSRKRAKLSPYHYNSFEPLRERMTEKDMLNLADEIMQNPLWIQKRIGETKYIFAHARTSHPLKQEQPDDFYLMGDLDLGQFFIDGIEGYISVCGHTPTSNVPIFEGRYLDKENHSIWMNEKENVILMDCGAGFKSGKLACMCLETGERFYSSYM